jgi:membrane-associated protease RseP (regulator of RpoE activity)
MGARLARNFADNVPPFSDNGVEAFLHLVRSPALLLAGLPFSLTMVTILLAHELGHYLACRHYRVDASLPYFLPAPTLIGTFGAFIRIRSPIYSRPMLFDIGIAGPLAGFLFLLPAFAIGLAYSKIIPNSATSGDLLFGVPLLEHLMTLIVFPGVPPSDVYLHPVARAAWVGVLATALNLLPIGQLDGGHIVYSFVGERHRLLSRVFGAVLLVIGILEAALIHNFSWLLWSVLLLVFGMRHPMVYDFTPLGPGRRRLGLLAFVIFILCITLVPISLGEGVL